MNRSKLAALARSEAAGQLAACGDFSRGSDGAVDQAAQVNPSLHILVGDTAGTSGALDSQEFQAGAARIAGSRFKRAFDIVGSLVGLIVLSPLLVLVAAVISIESPGNPLFRQRRSGFAGAPFVIYKFRTMRVSEDGTDVVQAQREDERITRFGLLLRRTSVDELPQLLNVLKGDMSLVGPRPHALVHDNDYGACIDGYGLRFQTKPGITGLAQVSGLRGPTPDVASMAARVEKDLEYIRSWSMILDVSIVVRTAGIFAFHPSAY